MIIYLPIALSSALLIILIVSVIFFLKYTGILRNRYEDIISASSIEKDAIIKKYIVFEEEIKALRERFDRTNIALRDSNMLAEKLRGENKDLYIRTSGLVADNKNLKEKIENQKNDYELRLAEQKHEFFDLENRFKDAFENLSSKMLDDKSKKFTEINRESIYGILNPLSEKINEFQKRVEETYDKESKQRFSLQAEIGKLVETESTMKRTADNLTTALKGTAKVQGDWGEMILEKLLEDSGLIKDTHYEIQKTLETSDETEGTIKLRPDVIVHFPQKRDLIIDSKVSLTDYERYINSESHNGYGGSNTDVGKDKDRFLKSHINSIKKHINELSEKNYSGLLGANSLDAVVMFIPIEFSYTVAINYDRDLLTYAYSRNIVIATPSIIMLILRIVSSLWIHEKSMKNAYDIMKIAGNLYDKFCSFSKSMEDIGKNLEKTRDAYEESRSRLSTGRGNIMGRFDKIKKLGAKVTKSLDEDKFDGEEIETDVTYIDE
ncbi:DNA recombination protein RmuC [Candidatus Acidulodesulfobacterium sp. H_13]|uniref:DNA recombination protein RmuC n=1 Tax=Candidatus Acidulodesulfobacterium sp. H_13 TaxID=3395470 RepID=UPI003AF7545C